MGSSTQTVGGGSATSTADMFNKFLLDGLQNGKFGNMPGATGANGAATGAQQAGQQSGAFGSAINNMLSGTVGDPTTYSQYFDQMKAQGNGGFGGYQATNFQSLNPTATNAYGQAFGQGGFANGPNAFGGAGGASAGISNYDPNNTAHVGNVLNAGNTVGNLSNPNMNDPQYAALKAIQDQRTQQDVANVRARFGAGGGSALGTGASFAESQYLSQANPQNTLAMYNIGQQMQQMDMANRGQNAQMLLGQQGNMINQRGQDVNSLTSTGNANAQNVTSAGIANAQMGQQAALAQMAARFQAMGMDSDTAYRAAMANNANAFGENQAHNTFGLQNQQQMNQFGLGQAGIGAQMAGLSQQGQQFGLGQLFGAYNNANNLGTAQAQTVEKPSVFGQILSGAGQLANIGTGIYSAMNPFGRQQNGPTGMPTGVPTGYRPPALPQGQGYGYTGSYYNPQFAG